MTIKKIPPTPYYHKPPMRFQDFEIYHNKDYSLEHIVENTHSYYEFYFLISGDTLYIVDGNEYHLKSGDVILIAPEQVHEAFINTKNPDAYERYVLWMDPKFLERLSTAKTNLLLPFQNTAISGSLLSLTPDMKIVVNNLLELIFTYSVSQEFGADLMVNSYIIELLVNVARIKLFQKNYYEKYFPQNEKISFIISDIFNYINEHIYENILVEDVASRFFISRPHLSKIFKKEVGFSLHQFIVKKSYFWPDRIVSTGCQSTMSAQNTTLAATRPFSGPSNKSLTSLLRP